jgi:hypothetical protein
LPLVVTVWDAPEYFITNGRLDPWARRRILSIFDHVASHAQTISVASDGMKALYEGRYGTRGVTMAHGIDRRHWRQRPASPAAEDRLVIAFAGSLYAKQEWNALVGAIEGSGGTIAGRRVSIRFVGRFPRLGARTATFVEKAGPHSFDESMEQLSQADVAYLPYWFDPRRALIAQTSFPGKMSAYVAAGVPVLYHGPRDSSPTLFLQQYPVGVGCHSLRHREIISALEKLASDVPTLEAASAVRQRALDEVLGLEAMLRRFADLLGIAPEDLV